MRNDTIDGGVMPAVVINNVSLPAIEVDGQRVVTLAMIDKVHGRPDGTAGRNFRENRSRLLEGEEYWKISADEFRRRFPGVISPRATEDITVLSVDGYLMLVKSFTDDLAWQVQRRLVKSYFARKNEDRPSQTPSIDVAREQRLQYASHLRTLKMIGITGNQAVLAANQATMAMTGISTLGLMGITHIDAARNEALLSPRDIATRMGDRSDREVNKQLIEIGAQTMWRDSKGRIHYEPTEAGRRLGGTMQDTSKRHSSGAPVQQLRWPSSIMEVL